jgi:foldase protein PrsA
MNSLLKHPVANLGLGSLLGAVVVGAIWLGTLKFGHEEDKVVAKVGDTPITQSDFLKQTQSEAGAQSLSDLISEQLVLAGAKKYGITASQKDINDMLNTVKEQNNITSDEQLSTLLQQSHMTMADLKKNLKIQVLAQKLSERNVKVTEKEIQDYYNKNKKSLAGKDKKSPALKDVRSKIVATLKQQKAESTSQLLADLAKQFPITIVDPEYKDVKTNIENPSTSALG